MDNDLGAQGGCLCNLLNIKDLGLNGFEPIHPH
jgi:hypothetical protein